MKNIDTHLIIFITCSQKKLAELSKKNNLDQFIHVSALGVEDAIDSKYASSKIKGENAIKNISENYVILKPSLIYSVDDKFTTMLMSMIKIFQYFQFITREKQHFIQFMFLICVK